MAGKGGRVIVGFGVVVLGVVGERAIVGVGVGVVLLLLLLVAVGGIAEDLKRIPMEVRFE
jgi:hypothetical protein